MGHRTSSVAFVGGGVGASHRSGTRTLAPRACNGPALTGLTVSLRQNALILILLTGLFGIVGAWSAPAEMGHLWALPAALLLLGLAYEAALASRCVVELELQTPDYWPLARPQLARFIFRQHSRPRLALQAVLSAPDEFASQSRIETLQLAAAVATVLTLSSAPRRLGRYSWPAPTIRVGGVLRLAWWSRSLTADRKVTVVPDVVSEVERSLVFHGASAKPRTPAAQGQKYCSCANIAGAIRCAPSIGKQLHAAGSS